jgi:glutathione S-transferase
MIKIYGTSMSRTGRCLWALEEVGAKYEHVPTPVPQARTPEHLKLNPNGHIPVLDDNGFIVWESMAINSYLAEKYGKSPLWPSTAEGRAGVNQWSFWAMTEM